MYYSECIVCGCSLDPGEGIICDECREEQEKRCPGTAGTEPGQSIAGATQKVKYIVA